MKTTLLLLISCSCLICQGQAKQIILTEKSPFSADSFIHKVFTKELLNLNTVNGVTISQQKTFEEVLSDTLVNVFYTKPGNTNSKPAIFIDSVFIGSHLSFDIDNKDIMKIDVVSGQIIINSSTFNGKLYITTHSKKHFSLLSLNQIKAIYLTPSDNNSVFEIDNKIITENPDTYFLDKNYIYKIFVTKITASGKNNEKGTVLDLIQILLKTKENFDSYNKNILMLRGE